MRLQNISKPLPEVEIAVRPAVSDEDVQVATSIMAAEHARDSQAFRQWLFEEGQRYPHYRREHTRIATINGKIAGALRITTDTIRIGEARLKMGGVGCVTTLPPRRRQGVGQALMRDALGYMRQHNYHVSMLFGIPDYYGRFGYVSALVECAVCMDTLEALRFENPYATRPAKPGDIPAMQRIHNASDADTACSIVRGAAHIRNKWKRWPDWRVLTDPQGKVIAYFYPRIRERTLAIDETGVEDLRLCGAVLHACAKIATRHSLAQIRVAEPPPGMLARFALPYRSIHEMRLDRNAGGMLAFVDIYETCESMIPEWESRLAKAGALDSRCEFTFYVEGRPIRIRVNRGGIDVAALPGQNKISLSASEFLHLVTGYQYAEDILAARPCLVRPDARALLPVLFPKRCPYVWPFDRF